MSIKYEIINRLHIFSALLPRKYNMWVFGCWEGRLYADNSKYLFEFINHNHPEVDCIWLTKSDEVKSELQNKGLKCYKKYSIKGILAAARAEFAFATSNEIDDISPFVNRNRTKVIQLWHGVAAKAAKWKDEKGHLMFGADAGKRYAAYYWMATSAKYIDIMCSFTHALKDRFYITGYSRNDTFITRPRNTNVEEILKSYQGKRFIIYMPTHRNFGKQSISVDEFSWLNDQLREANIIMVYKPHFHELQNLVNLNLNLTNILLANDEKTWGDVYSYIHYFDLLISDYSSIAFDFLCADKPIVLYTYDLEYYRTHDAGLWDFFEEVPAGPFCFTWQETMQQVNSLLENDTWHDRREICRKMFHPFKDGRNSERIYEALIKIRAGETEYDAEG